MNLNASFLRQWSERYLAGEDGLTRYDYTLGHRSPPTNNNYQGDLEVSPTLSVWWKRSTQRNAA